MTKKQELLRLDALIRDLSGDTYLGKWLREQRDYLAACLASDIYPSYTMKEAREKAQAEVEQASRVAARIKQDAEKEAKEIIEKARKEQQAMVFRQIHRLKVALKELESI